MASTHTDMLMRSPADTISRTKAATPTDAKDWCGRLRPLHNLFLNCQLFRPGSDYNSYNAGLHRHIADRCSLYDSAELHVF